MIQLHCSYYSLAFDKRGNKMNRAYSVKCTACDYAETFYLGLGYNDKNIVSEAVFNIITGFYGEQAEKFAVQSSTCKIECERTLYRCWQCGNLETRIKLRILAEEASYLPPHFCSRCGRLAGQVKPDDIEKQLCPVCKNPIEITDVSPWDIAPQPKR